MAATACHRDHIVIESDETLSWYRPKDEAKFGFCNRCGATVFWHTDANPESVSIAAGMFDVPTGLRTEFAFYTAEASDYFNLDESLVSFPMGPEAESLDEPDA